MIPIEDVERDFVIYNDKSRKAVRVGTNDYEAADVTGKIEQKDLAIRSVS